MREFIHQVLTWVLHLFSSNKEVSYNQFYYPPETHQPLPVDRKIEDLSELTFTDVHFVDGKPVRLILMGFAFLYTDFQPIGNGIHQFSYDGYVILRGSGGETIPVKCGDRFYITWAREFHLLPRG
ncbi:hypothetical protein [Shimazuella alba]|uniref:Uncharacterized protein n=1 Tax=Shimazuella alba TaxID=2690964 RepID=A0A6I4VUJ8_9BACL|nr:hypothetical protein [Shimazuella alba]MXQ53560.1 hypothetical protein [Shimazuella alba]